MDTKSLWHTQNNLRFLFATAAFIVFFTGAVQYLAIRGQGTDFSLSLAYQNSLGNTFSWKFVGLLSLWAILSLKVPSTIVYGPETSFGYKPPYSDNGVAYYWITFTIFLLIQILFPQNYIEIYTNMPQILGTFNIVAFLLCIYLLLKGKYNPEHKNDSLEPRPLVVEFYRGVELHPHILGIDVKQLTNCRIALMGWQLYISAFFLSGVAIHGFNMASFVNVMLQTIYIAKFFKWEAGYFYTLDMMLDRAGYYICWGCLVWVPCFYTYSSYFLVAHPPILTTTSSILIGFLGISTVFLNYRVDYEKQVFRSSPNFKCTLWGKPAKYILAEYKDATGKEKKTALLTSGFWGIARHLNYTFELMCTFAWCACGYGYGLWPFLYFIFLTVLLVHRTIRDEVKCQSKYGTYWEDYCRAVPYRLIPFVW